MDGRKIGCIALAIPLFTFTPLLALMLLLSALTAGSGAGAAAELCTPGAQKSGVTIDPKSIPNTSIAGYSREQLVNAAHIMRAGKALTLSIRDQTIGVMTAMGESNLRVIDHGDSAGPDSRGLFQQRDNGTWGSYRDRMDPFISATNFFRVLKTIPKRDELEPTIIAHRVQRNADPHHYSKFWPSAVQVVERLAKTQGVANGEQPPSSQYSLGNVKPQTANVANTVGPMFGIKTIGGYRKSAHDPDGHPAGLALDFMTNDIPDGSAVGDRLAQYLQTHADQLGVDYIIWKQRIWSTKRANEGWRGMKDRGSESANHYDHIHLSIKPDAGGITAPDCEPTAPSDLNPDDGTNPKEGTNSKGWVKPAAGPVTSRYGMRTNPVTGVYKLHAGIDLAGGGCDGPIWAAQSGVVIKSGFDSGGNGTIIIDHGNGIRTQYLHMYRNGILAREGERVNAGKIIGRVGSSGNSTGCHLHFGVRVNGSPVDPIPFMAKVGVTFE